jgi:hypothetical protein
MEHNKEYFYDSSNKFIYLGIDRNNRHRLDFGNKILVINHKQYLALLTVVS